jgi:hypothetical protein
MRQRKRKATMLPKLQEINLWQMASSFLLHHLFNWSIKLLSRTTDILHYDPQQRRTVCLKCVDTGACWRQCQSFSPFMWTRARIHPWKGRQAILYEFPLVTVQCQITFWHDRVAIFSGSVQNVSEVLKTCSLVIEKRLEASNETRRPIIINFCRATVLYDRAQLLTQLPTVSKVL